MPHRRPPHTAPRGIWLAPFTACGCRTYYAIDSRGELVASQSVPIGADPMEAIDALDCILERLDPSPLTLSGDGPSSFELRLA